MTLLNSPLRASLLKLALVLVAANSFLVGAAPDIDNIAQHPPNIHRRDHTTIWVTKTSTLPPATTTVNPRDPTITWPPPGWTITVGPPTSTKIITSPGCLAYSFISPPPDHPAPIATETVTIRNTVTVTDPNRLPLITQTIFPTPTITVTSQQTVTSIHCTNTLVVSYYDKPDAPATYTFTQWQSTSFITGLCKATITRSTTIPGVILPTTPPLQDWEYFSDGSTLATKYSIAILDLTQITVPGVTTSTKCDPSLNPSPAVSTWTGRFDHRTTTTVVTRVPDPSACTARSVNVRGANMQGSEDEALEARQVTATPIEVRTVVYTTVTVVNNTIRTLTGTAIVDVVTQSFPRTSLVWTTLTGTETVKVTSRVCPTAAAATH
ncbi:hypothetical protein V8F20_003492 [Naviculisporaceae sp. PSN 640]